MYRNTDMPEGTGVPTRFNIESGYAEDGPTHAADEVRGGERITKSYGSRTKMHWNETWEPLALLKKGLDVFVSQPNTWASLFPLERVSMTGDRVTLIDVVTSVLPEAMWDQLGPNATPFATIFRLEHERFPIYALGKLLQWSTPMGLVGDAKVRAQMQNILNGFELSKMFVASRTLVRAALRAYNAYLDEYSNGDQLRRYVESLHGVGSLSFNPPMFCRIMADMQKQLVVTGTASSIVVVANAISSLFLTDAFATMRKVAESDGASLSTAMLRNNNGYGGPNSITPIVTLGNSTRVYAAPGRSRYQVRTDFNTVAPDVMDDLMGNLFRECSFSLANNDIVSVYSAANDAWHNYHARDILRAAKFGEEPAPGTHPTINAGPYSRDDFEKARRIGRAPDNTTVNVVYDDNDGPRLAEVLGELMPYGLNNADVLAVANGLRDVLRQSGGLDWTAAQARVDRLVAMLGNAPVNQDTLLLLASNNGFNPTSNLNMTVTTVRETFPEETALFGLRGGENLVQTSIPGTLLVPTTAAVPTGVLSYEAVRSIAMSSSPLAGDAATVVSLMETIERVLSPILDRSEMAPLATQFAPRVAPGARVWRLMTRMAVPLYVVVGTFALPQPLNLKAIRVGGYYDDVVDADSDMRRRITNFTARNLVSSLWELTNMLVQVNINGSEVSVPLDVLYALLFNTDVFQFAQTLSNYAFGIFRQQSNEVIAELMKQAFGNERMELVLHLLGKGGLSLTDAIRRSGSKSAAGELSTELATAVAGSTATYSPAERVQASFGPLYVADFNEWVDRSAGKANYGGATPLTAPELRAWSRDTLARLGVERDNVWRRPRLITDAIAGITGWSQDLPSSTDDTQVAEVGGERGDLVWLRVPDAGLSDAQARKLLQDEDARAMFRPGKPAAKYMAPAESLADYLSGVSSRLVSGSVMDDSPVVVAALATAGEMDDAAMPQAAPLATGVEFGQYSAAVEAGGVEAHANSAYMARYARSANIIKRVTSMPDFVRRATELSRNAAVGSLALLVLGLRMDIGTIDVLAEHGVPLPFKAMAFRVDATYRTHPVIMCASDAITVVVSDINVIQSSNGLTAMSYARFESSVGSYVNGINKSMVSPHAAFGGVYPHGNTNIWALDENSLTTNRASLIPHWGPVGALDNLPPHVALYPVDINSQQNVSFPNAALLERYGMAQRAERINELPELDWDHSSMAELDPGRSQSLFASSAPTLRFSPNGGPTRMQGGRCATACAQYSGASGVFGGSEIFNTETCDRSIAAEMPRISNMIFA